MTHLVVVVVTVMLQLFNCCRCGGRCFRRRCCCCCWQETLMEAKSEADKAVQAGREEEDRLQCLVDDFLQVM